VTGSRCDDLQRSIRLRHEETSMEWSTIFLLQSNSSCCEKAERYFYSRAEVQSTSQLSEVAPLTYPCRKPQSCPRNQHPSPHLSSTNKSISLATSSGVLSVVSTLNPSQPSNRKISHLSLKSLRRSGSVSFFVPPSTRPAAAIRLMFSSTSQTM